MDAQVVLAEAINHAGHNGADVVNPSLGSLRASDLLEDLIGDDDDHASSGRYPAVEDGALTVTSVDQERKKSSFADYGGWVDVA